MWMWILLFVELFLSLFLLYLQATDKGEEITDVLFGLFTLLWFALAPLLIDSFYEDFYEDPRIDQDKTKLMNENFTIEAGRSEEYVSAIMKQILQNGEEVDRSTVLKYATVQCDEITVEDGETVFTFGDQKLTETELYEQFGLK